MIVENKEDKEGGMAHTQPVPPKKFRNLKFGVIVIDML
jgi:hypothetical protein